MNPSLHTKLSIKSNKLTDEDYDFFFKIHSKFDSSKEIESSNLHRCLTHHIFFLRRVIIPIFGATYKSKNGKVVDIKDDMEQSHLLSDFNNRYIPTLSDYTSLCSNHSDDEKLFQEFRKENEDVFKDKEIEEFLLAPLNNTGLVKSLFLTHNSWILNEIIPQIFKKDIKIKNFNISPSMFFNRCRFTDWIQNGQSGELPPSFVKIDSYRKNKISKIINQPIKSEQVDQIGKEKQQYLDEKNKVRDVIYDGSRGAIKNVKIIDGFRELMPNKNDIFNTLEHDDGGDRE